MRGLGLLLLGIWLIVTGVLPLLNLTSPALDLVLTALAIVAGVLLLVEGLRTRRGLPNNIGIILLGVWLIVVGLLPFVNLPQGEVILNVLSIIVGVVILVRR